MTFLPAVIWNQIAETQKLETPAAKIAFRLDSRQIAKLDDVWTKEEEAAGTPPEVARCLPKCLPLLLERQAIGQYVNQHPDLRSVLPEVNNPEEAVDLMTAEYHLSPLVQKQLLAHLRSSPGAQTKWMRAAEKVAQRWPAGGDIPNVEYGLEASPLVPAAHSVEDGGLAHYRVIPPREKFEAMATLGQKLFFEGVDTPEKLARELGPMGAEAEGFSQSIWSMLKAFGAKGSSEPDWAAVYAIHDAKDVSLTHSAAWSLAGILLDCGMLSQVEDELLGAGMSINPASRSQEDVAEALAALLENYPSLLDWERLKGTAPEDLAEVCLSALMNGLASPGANE